MSLLAALGLAKSFPGVRALDGVDFELQSGEVHALVGENGAGKSTLGKIVAGVFPPDQGELALKGEPVAFRSPREALGRGIALVAQEVALVPQRSVAENVFLGAEPRRFGFIRRLNDSPAVGIAADRLVAGRHGIRGRLVLRLDRCRLRDRE